MAIINRSSLSYCANNVFNRFELKVCYTYYRNKPTIIGRLLQVIYIVILMVHSSSIITSIVIKTRSAIAVLNLRSDTDLIKIDSYLPKRSLPRVASGPSQQLAFYPSIIRYFLM